MAAALGTDTSRIYAVTFAFGAALGGLGRRRARASLRRLPQRSAAPISAAPSSPSSAAARRRLPAPLRLRLLFGVINQIATFADQSGLRRGGASARGDRADPQPAARNHRPLSSGDAYDRNAAGECRIGRRRRARRGTADRPAADARSFRASADHAVRHLRDPRTQPRLRLGLWRHPVLRPLGLLRTRRVRLRGRGHQYRRKHRSPSYWRWRCRPRWRPRSAISCSMRASATSMSASSH